MDQFKVDMTGISQTWDAIMLHLAAFWNSIHLSHTEKVWLWIGVGLVVIVLALRWRWRYWKRMGEAILVPGAIGPKPNILARIVRYLVLGRLFVRIHMGKVKVIGRRNLWYNGRLVTWGPHFSYLDDGPIMVRFYKIRPMRYFVAREEAIGNRERVAKLRGFAGTAGRFAESLRTPLLAFTGGIVVDRGDHNATAAALRAAIEAMDRDENASFGVFPEGKTRPAAQLVVENFFTGALKLIKRIKRQPLRRHFPLFRKPMPDAILPWAPLYRIAPEPESFWHRFIVYKLGIKNFRKRPGGYLVEVIAVFGTPIPVDEFGDDLDAEKAKLVNRIDRFRRHAIAAGKHFDNVPGEDGSPTRAPSDIGYGY